MDDSSKNFVQTLRDKLRGFEDDEDKSTDTSGYTVEEHDFEELDDRTQTAVNKMFDTMRITSEQLKKARLAEESEAAYKTTRLRTLSSS